MLNIQTPGIMTMISNSDRISVSYRLTTPPARGLEAGMLIDDLSDSIVPYNSRDDKVNCFIKPADPDFEKILCDVLPTYGRDSQLADVVLESIRYIAKVMAVHGQIVLEYVTEIDVNDEKNYSLHYVYGDKIKIKKREIQQIIPKEIAKSNNIPQVYSIPREKCFVIDFPKELGGTKGYLKFLNNLKKIGKETPMFKALNSPLQKVPGYDLMEHSRIHDMKLWKATLPLHWHHRSGGDKYFSGYYSTCRRLNFRKKQIILRNHIISELKGIVSEIAKKFGKNAELQIENLVSLSEIDDIISKWHTGVLRPYDTKNAMKW